MNIFITGGTGFIGTHLIKVLLSENHKIKVLTRSEQKAEKIFGSQVKVVGGDPLKREKWTEELAGCDAVINLCGEVVLERKWTERRKRTILNSRVLPTRIIVETLEKMGNKPKVLISGSAVGYYSNRGAEKITEEAGPGSDFGAILNIEWEAEARKAESLGVRVATIRTGLVLGHDEGGLVKMLTPYKFFIGGPIGSGKQYLSWIHINDEVGIIKMALTDKNIKGAVNATAPNPVTNREFSKTLGKILKRPSLLPTPPFMLKLMFGEGAALLTEGQRVIPQKALNAGYKFQFDNLESALKDVLI